MTFTNEVEKWRSNEVKILHIHKCSIFICFIDDTEYVKEEDESQQDLDRKVRSRSAQNRL